MVAPTSVVPNWRAEAAKFTPSLRVLVLQGPKRRKDFPVIPHADLVLTSFALLQRDIAQLGKIDFHLIILDEAQHIKNPGAKVSKAACELKGAHRLCLSGTPIENHLGELWSLMRFLIPGFLGSLENFRERFQNPIEKEEDDDRRDDLKSRLAPLILRRTKDEVASELPPKTILVHPNRPHHRAEGPLRNGACHHGQARAGCHCRPRHRAESRIVFLDALLKLRQICCDPRLLRDTAFQASDARADEASAKLDYLGEPAGRLSSRKGAASSSSRSSPPCSISSRSGSAPWAFRP